MEKMLVTQALDVRELLRKKINDSIRSADLIDVKKPGSDKLQWSKLSLDEFTERSKAKLQSIKDMIDRYYRLDAAILLSNATTKIKIGDKEMTVAAAINLRKTLATKNDEKDLNGALIFKLQVLLGSANDFIAKSEEAANKQRESMCNAVASSDNEKISGDSLNSINAYCDGLVYKMVDPLNIKDMYDELSSEREELKANIESAIKISNATTFIEF